MASKQGTVGNTCVSVLLFSALLSLSCSSADLRENGPEYSLVDGTPASFSKVVHVEAIHSLRTKRQASSSTSSSSGGSSVTQVSSTTVPPPSSPQSQGGMSTVPPQTPVPPQAPQPTTTAPQNNQNMSTLPPIVTEGNHNYYMSKIIPDAIDDYFVELLNPLTHSALNSAHRVAGVINLPFRFRFYGHTVTNVTVATGGFIYMSPFLHRHLAHTQYVAPLMANFHTAASNDSSIFYQHVGDEFIVEWQQVMLKDEEERGSFTFQAKLKTDGTITFVYKKLPVPVTNISSAAHPVKIGLSDAFYNDTYFPKQGFIRRRIYVYRQDWEKKGCKVSDGSCRSGKKDTVVAAAVTVSVLLLILLVVVGVWVYYAYTHPTSPSGIWLMEHRPTVLRAKLANMSCCKQKPPPSSKYAMESKA